MGGFTAAGNDHDSTSPRATSRKASPMALVPVAQAVTTALTGPRAPKAMETCPAAMLPMIMGTKKGLKVAGPLLEVYLVLAFDGADPADAGANHYPDPPGIRLFFIQSGLSPGLFGSGNGVR